MAAPREYAIDDFPESFRDLREQSLYSSPWPPGWWRLADAMAYDETAALSTLEFAAKYKESLLYNRYQAGRDQIARGRKDAPYAYVVPQDQRDPVAAVEMLRRLAFAGVRVSQLTAPLAIDGVTYPAGTWIVPTDQEFAAMARELLDVQKYPDLRQYPGGPPLRPYDAAGWTLPLQMGVRVASVATPLTDDLRAKMKVLGPMPEVSARPSLYDGSNGRDAAPFDSVPGLGFDANPSAAPIVPPPGRISGNGPALAVDQPCMEAGRQRPVPRRRRERRRPIPVERVVRIGAGGARQGPRAGGGTYDGEWHVVAQTACRPVPAVERQHGRGMDALGARAVRLPARDPPPRGLPFAPRRQSGRGHPR
jgi:hypothetical protein